MAKNQASKSETQEPSPSSAAGSSSAKPSPQRGSSGPAETRNAGPSAGPTSKATAQDTVEGDVVRGDGAHDQQRSYSTTEPSPLAQQATEDQANATAREREPNALMDPMDPATTERAEGSAGTGAQTHLGAALADIRTPEQAVSVMKEKVHLLHTIVNNVGHFSSLAFNDVEQLMADIRWLGSFIRSKV